MAKQTFKLRPSTWIILTLSVLLIGLMQYSCEEEMQQINTQQLLEHAIRQQVLTNDADTYYFIKWFDLNVDGSKEAIVHVTGKKVCQKEKCDTYIFSWDSISEAYLQIGKIKSSLPPIIASPKKHQGWYDLYLYQHSPQRSDIVGLIFNGKRYMISKKVPEEMQDVDSPFGAPLLLPHPNYLDGIPLFQTEQSDDE